MAANLSVHPSGIFVLVLTEDWVDKSTGTLFCFIFGTLLVKAFFRIQISIDFALLDPDLDPGAKKLTRINN